MLRDWRTLAGAAVTAACSLALLVGFMYLNLRAAASAPAGGPPDARAEAAPATATTNKAANAPTDPGFNEPAEPYDPAAIARDPDAYYGRSVPNRVWQTAPLRPGSRQPRRLMGQIEPFRIVAANGPDAVPMLVRGEPGQPVTFTALDHGHFSNGKISITVRSDEEGYARADFYVGEAGDFRVLAGSPENLGRAEFTLQALPADELKSVRSGEYARDYLAKLEAKAKRDKAAAATARPAPPAAPCGCGGAPQEQIAKKQGNSKY
jgi:hypothetical protein